jgi:carbamoyltransferase
MERLILGLNTDHAGSSACLVGNKGIIAAIAEERLNRIKHSAAFPKSAILEVLKIAGAEMKDITDVAVARDSNSNLGPKIRFVSRNPLHAGSLALQRLKIHRKVRSTGDRIAAETGFDRDSIKARFHRVEHHLAHIASAFYWSPFEESLGFSVDGAGDFASSMAAECSGSSIRVLERTYWPHSLGVFYTALCQFLGFDRYGEEYKLMGLAAYGENTYSDLMRDIVSFGPSGLRLNLSYFQHHKNTRGFETLKDGEVVLPRLWSDKLAQRLGANRKRSEPISKREEDMSASMQKRYEEVFLAMVKHLVDRTGHVNIALAGGSVLNSVANGRMLTEGLVQQAYFQPAASDDGTSVGAASLVLHQHYGIPRTDPVFSAFWGKEWSEEEIEFALKENDRPYRRLTRQDLISNAVRSIASGEVLGWFQGREEWGPRALGNRSILCNPALPDMKEILNSRIKNREPFRPFAPVIREEDLSECFEGTHPVPFMIVVYKVRPGWRNKLPAITHEDNTGRVQTVNRFENPLFYDLISVFRKQTGIPVILNTSFNENEPIVHSPAQAIDCFERTRMDSLGIGPFWLTKKNDSIINKQ